MGCFEYRVFDRLAYCGRVASAGEWADQFFGGAALGWDLFDGGDVLVGGILVRYFEVVEEGVEDIAARIWDDVLSAIHIS